MADKVDEYIAQTIREGDKGSKLLHERCKPTLKNSQLVEIISEGMGGIAVLRPPKNCLIAVHSSGGDPGEKNLERYVYSFINRLVSDSQRIGAEPLGIGDIIDASSMDLNTIARIGDELRERAGEYSLPILNGELADLGARVNCEANISGTMISAIPKTSKFVVKVPGIFVEDGVTYAVFYPEGKLVFINLDGIGTKTDFYEKLIEQLQAIRDVPLDSVYNPELLPCGVEDFAAMNLDDAAKLGAEAKVLSGVIETRGQIPVKLIEEKLRRIAAKMGVLGILQHEEVGDRIRGYREGAATYNISGSSVSVIDEGRLRNLPKPKEGNTLVAICGLPNPRSNGISSKRRIMIELFGENWHKTPAGKIFMEYLSSPSTILYPVFSELLKEGLATSVFHNSGGAYNGKLARPLANHGLYVELKDLFEPDWREVALAAYSPTTRDAYAKYPMGTDGFVATSKPEEAIALIEQRGLKARAVGKLEKLSDRTGVKLTAYNGQEVDFSGKD